MVNIVENLLDGVDSIKYEEVFYKDLVPSEYNKYPMVTEEIKDLANSILNYGLFHTLYTIRIKGEDDTTIISGEKRYRAFCYLIDELNHHELEMIPTRVYVIKENMDPVEMRVRIMEANAKVRDRSDPDIIQMEVNEAMDILKELEAKGKSPKGRTRDIVARMIGRKPRVLQEFINAYNVGNDAIQEAGHDETIEIINSIREKGKEEKKNKDIPANTIKTLQKFINFIAGVDLEEVFEKCDEGQTEALSKELIELKNVVDQSCAQYYK